MRLIALLSIVWTMGTAHASVMNCHANGEFFAVPLTKNLVYNAGPIQMNNTKVSTLKSAVKSTPCTDGEQFFFYIPNNNSICVYTCDDGKVDLHFVQLFCEK